jgi:hypothetical protein
MISGAVRAHKLAKTGTGKFEDYAFIEGYTFYTGCNYSLARDSIGEIVT